MTQLDEALALLRGDGDEPQWTKGQFVRFEHTHFSYCILGAIDRTAIEMFAPEYKADRLAVGAVIREQFPERTWQGMGRIGCFNDHPDTTFQDVELVLQKAYLKRVEEV